MCGVCVGLCAGCMMARRDVRQAERSVLFDEAPQRTEHELFVLEPLAAALELIR